MTITDERRQEILALGPLFEMKPQKVPAYWQCIRLVPRHEFSTKTQDEFNPPSMTAYAVCIECGDIIQYRPGGNEAVMHMKNKHHALLANYVQSPRKKRKSKRRKSSDGHPIVQVRRDLTKDEKAKVKKAVAKWIARRMRPISIVEDRELQQLCDLLGQFGGFNVTLPGRTAVRESIVTTADELRGRLMEELAAHKGYYCLTTDIWTDRCARSYMSLTIHYVDDTYRIHNKLLGVAPFPGKHDGARIGEMITQLLDKWNLDKAKCAMLLRDGASNAVKGALYANIRSMSCIAHSLQLVLAGALMRVRKTKPVEEQPKAKPANKTSKKKAASKRTRGTGNVEPVAEPVVDPCDEEPRIQENSNQASVAAAQDSETDDDEDVASLSLDFGALQLIRDSARDEVDHHVQQEATLCGKIALDRIRAKVALFRRIATYFRRSPKAKYRLSRIQNPRAALGLILDCPTRWSSSHAMLARFEEIKADMIEFFAHLQTPSGDAEFSDSVLKEIPSQEDWFYIRCLRTLLQPFSDVTTKLSGEMYPTFIIAFPFLRMIKQYLRREDLLQTAFGAVSTEPFAQRVLGEMQEVRQEILSLFTKRFRGMDTELLWVPLLDPRVADMSYLEPFEIDYARDCFIQAMVDEEETPVPLSPEPESVRPSFFSPLRGQPSVIAEFEARLYGKQRDQPVQASNEDREQQHRLDCKSEAFRYINMIRQSKPKQLPLDWWRDNGIHFPTIARLAKKWLGCPATSVPSERAFSTAGNIVTLKRASLTPEMVENLTILAHN